MTAAEIAALLRQGMAHHAAGRIADAAALYGRVLRRAPDDGNAHNLAGIAARQMGDMAAALDHGARAVASNPGSAIFHANFGATLAESGRLPQAVKAFRHALAARPDDAVTQRNLGQALSTLGDTAAAVEALQRAADLAPDAPEPHLALAHTLRDAGDLPGAAKSARAALARCAVQPEMAEQARFLLAALGEAPAPARAPAGYVRDLFDQYAPRFDAELTGRLGYATPGELAALLDEAGIPAARGLEVLDLGCGTGLSGQPLLRFAARLTGLDLSPRMLAAAKARGIYETLVEADLLAWLPTQPAGFDLIVAADVLNYLGDLAPAFAAIAGALRPGGHAGFSIETGDAVPFALGEGLRYRHAPAHVRALLADAGLSLVSERDAVLRQEKGGPVEGQLFVVRK
ncbi:MAG TPA: methyltransferase domain-containing protein [Roseomonas sp.]|jgi:predicted TPR repeat methyltransferase